MTCRTRRKAGGSAAANTSGLSLWNLRGFFLKTKPHQKSAEPWGPHQRSQSDRRESGNETRVYIVDLAGSERSGPEALRNCTLFDVGYRMFSSVRWFVRLTNPQNPTKCTWKMVSSMVFRCFQALSGLVNSCPFA